MPILSAATSVNRCFIILFFSQFMTETMATASAIPSLDEAHIARLVDCFYDKVRADDHIGPVFNRVVADWDEHKEKLTRFWCSVALNAGTYRDSPMRKHLPLSIDQSHFQRWVELWRQTVPEIMDTEAANTMIGYAENIRRGMSMGIGLEDPGLPGR